MNKTLICIVEGVVIIGLGAGMFLFHQKNVEVKEQNIALLAKNEETTNELTSVKTEIEALKQAIKSDSSDRLAESANWLIEKKELKETIKTLEQEKNAEIEKLTNELAILKTQFEGTPAKAEDLEPTPEKTTAEKSTKLKKVDDATLKKRHVTKKYDFMEEITWFSTERNCASKVSDFTSLSIQLYLGQAKENRLILRLKINYLDASAAVAELQREARRQGVVIKELQGKSSNGKWLMYDKVLIKGSNSKSARIDIKYNEKDSEIGDMEGVMVLKEWSDSYVGDVADDLLEIAKANKIYVKLYGDSDSIEFEMSKEQTYAFKEMMQMYNSLK